jgi:hypothetical protein
VHGRHISKRLVLIQVMLLWCEPLDNFEDGLIFGFIFHNGLISVNGFGAQFCLKHGQPLFIPVISRIVPDSLVAYM